MSSQPRPCSASSSPMTARAESRGLGCTRMLWDRSRTPIDFSIGVCPSSINTACAVSDPTSIPANGILRLLLRAHRPGGALLDHDVLYELVYVLLQRAVCPGNWPRTRGSW